MKVRDRQDRSRVEELVRAGGSGGGAGGEVNNPAERAAMEAELIRLKRNMERRKVREAQKAAKMGLATGDGDGKVLPGQTQRKCANCGQLGHIKTNKK
jgi:transcription initiation factor TFIID subunit 1